MILATSTVDVGFNFEREIKTDRQNLDWLIFSARDRFSFWQRIGRVGRVLGKQITTIPSEAIASAGYALKCPDNEYWVV